MVQLAPSRHLKEQSLNTALTLLIHPAQSLNCDRFIVIMEAGEVSSNFRRKIGYLLQLSRNTPSAILLSNSTRTFIIPTDPQTPETLLTLIHEIFESDLQGLAALARREGLRVKNARREGRQVMVFQSGEPLIKGITSLESILTPGDSEQEEEEQRMLEKHPHIYSSVPHNSWQPEGRQSFEEVVSLAAKVPANFTAFQPVTARQGTPEKLSAEEEREELGGGDFRENYERCSRLIDATIVELLRAHKGKQLEDHSEELLGRVTQIYDLLSDNIEQVRGAGLSDTAADTS